ncbi:tellurite resistance domain protein [Intestinirhabdus alba]|jgi:tellurite resistance protein TerA|uniref:Tellurite resistance domain protein n=1 Tax=Intestinirhabdus alba TaxID=2899544 RepID=A0A6L6II39_9ENTR|nr:tellurite resistance domain protein [Intestinirhabdus alba]MTH46259.1 tellurite resistance domain protein [Intestinirhabdus alba]
MQRLISAAPIDETTLATWKETVAIIHRHLPPALALLYASPRRSAGGNLEWWTPREGLARPQSALDDAGQLRLQNKCQQYQTILAGLTEQLDARGDRASAAALRMLLTRSQEMTCYDVGGEPVLINWAQPPREAPPAPPVPAPAAGRKRLLPRLLAILLLLLLLLALAWWFMHRAATAPQTELTQQNPSVSLAGRKDFGRITINLTWQRGTRQEPIDLDIAAFIRFKNGDRHGVEALSKLSGSYDKPPFVRLQKDLRDGDDEDGEWIVINGSRWQEMDEVLIYSFIYGGASSWQGTEATITLTVPGQPPIHTTLSDDSELSGVAAIARLKNVNGDIKIERLNRFFPNREALDKHYGWGFEWSPGASKNQAVP